MIRSWFSGAERESVTELIARRKFGKAIELLRALLKEHRRDERLRQQLAEVLSLDGQKREAVDVLEGLADEYALGGFTVKAIAILKKIQRIDPSNAAVEEKLACMVRERDRQIAATAPPLPVFDPSHAEIGIELTAEELPTPLPLVDDGLPGTTEPPKDTIASNPLFRGFAEDELVAVIQGLRLQSFEPGDIIVAEAEPGESLFLVATGTVKAWVRDATGHMKLMRHMDDGAFFGEISIIDRKPRTATITAATWCELLELDRGTLDSISAKHPRVFTVMRQFYNERIGAKG